MPSSQPDQTRAHLHPRRRPLKYAPPSLMDSSPYDTEHASPSQSVPKITLKKGETFNSPTSTPSEDRDPVLNIRSLPRRSPTCPRTLEAIAAGEERMADILSRLSLSDVPAPNAEDNHHVKDDLPVHAAVRRAHASKPNSPAPRETSPNETKNHAHGSDSGIGTSISSKLQLTDSSDTQSKVSVKEGQLSDCEGGTQSALTSSISAIQSVSSGKRQLPLEACKHIERNILIPILKDKSLKPFHPLVKSIPKRIVNKEIVCLRDLEKTFMWLGPIYSEAKYIDFCEVSIQCIHTTTTHLNDRDQRLPADIPYTNGYFLDLIEQVRQYAATLSRAREAIERNNETAESDSKTKTAAPTERLTLEGGLSKTGRPAELVVHKDGQPISLRTGEPYNKDAAPTIKRSLSIEEVDEGVDRSMARRKKNAPPMDINKKCNHCDKVFKRPCDLTKHEKTHSRPWKCSVPSCKYHEIGWPTEKERDRHVNDKHSNAPALFKCSFAPCTYQSKRESNCKQHMEKAHGWTYVRSKNNGRHSKKGSSVQPTPQTPSVSTPASKAVDLPTPATGPSPSPFEPPQGYPQDPPFSFADPPMPNQTEDFQLFPENNFNAFPTSMDFEAFQSHLEGCDPNGFPTALDGHRQSFDSNSVPDLVGTSMGLDGSPVASTDNTSLNFDLDWSSLDPSSFDEEFTTMPMQVVTPEQPEQMNGMGAYSHDPAIAGPSPLSMQAKIPGLSPGASSKLMLYSGDEYLDESVAHMYQNGYQPKSNNDFTLYDNSMSMASTQPNMSGLRRDMNQMIPAVNSLDNYPNFNQPWAGHPGMPDGMHPEMDMDYFG